MHYCRDGCTTVETDALETMLERWQQEAGRTERQDLSQALTALPYTVCVSVSTSPTQSAGHEAEVSSPSQRPFPQHSSPCFLSPACASMQDAHQEIIGGPARKR